MLKMAILWPLLNISKNIHSSAYELELRSTPLLQLYGQKFFLNIFAAHLAKNGDFEEILGNSQKKSLTDTS